MLLPVKMPIRAVRGRTCMVSENDGFGRQSRHWGWRRDRPKLRR